MTPRLGGLRFGSIGQDHEKAFGCQHGHDLEEASGHARECKRGRILGVIKVDLDCQCIPPGVGKFIPVAGFNRVVTTFIHFYTPTHESCQSHVHIPAPHHAPGDVHHNSMPSHARHSVTSCRCLLLATDTFFFFLFVFVVKCASASPLSRTQYRLEIPLAPGSCSCWRPYSLTVRIERVRGDRGLRRLSNALTDCGTVSAMG